MPYVIPHRFIERLLPHDHGFIRYVMIGSFNPGKPIPGLMTLQERAEAEIIFETKKYRRFDQVRNFYDRPTNRLWGVFDRLDKPALYLGKPASWKNPAGLKHYKSLNRQEIFDRQQSFCSTNGIFLTDIIREIRPGRIEKIYTNFSDTDIDFFVHEWNTEGLLKLIDKYKPEKIIFNFKEGANIPRISGQMKIIKNHCSNKVIHLDSPSGAAGNTYDNLVGSWGNHFNLT